MVARVGLRQAPHQTSSPNRHLRTPQTGVSEVAGRVMRGGRGQALRGRASKLGQGTRGTRAFRAQIPALGSQLIRAPMKTGGPSDEKSRVSMEGQTNVRTCCCDCDLMRSES
jgi:hypothetical protein